MSARALAAAVALAAAGVHALAQNQSARRTGAGTASVSGVVVSALDPAQPVRRAIVTISGGGELSRSAVTDDGGRFAIGSVPAGTYTLAVSKAAYLPMTYGALAPGRAGTPFVVREGETVANLRIPFTRGAAISGTVRDFSGEPAEGVQVVAIRAGLATGRREVTFVSGIDAVSTDDTGTYRIFGLAPGAYLVAAIPRVSGGDALAVLDSERVDAELRLLQQRGGGAQTPPMMTERGRGDAAPLLRFAPVFHPSASLAAQAAPVTVAAGEDRRGVDVLLALSPVATIEGQVIGVDGQPAPAVSVSISTIGPPLPTGAGGLLGSPPPTPDGRFRYPSVPPGSWTITARASARVVSRNPDGSLRSVSGNANELPPGPFYWGASTVDVNGGTVRVTVQLRPGLAMTGKVVLDGAAPAASRVNLTAVRLTLAPDSDPTRATAAVFPGAPPAAGSPAADGSFELRGLTPGFWELTGIVPGGAGPNGWWLRSAMLDGRDLLDAPIEMTDRDLAGVELTFTNRHTAIAGTLTGADGKPASDLVVVVMPADRALWSSLRRIRQTRPATDGTFSFADLPAGSYLLAAVTDVPEENWRSMELLSSIAPAGVPLTLVDGERKRQDLRVNRRP
jgi:hypothetical protein